jgi:tetratricopeptide (TPR) repeat protein
MERDRSKVSGIIVNAVTDEPIPSASVLVKNSRTGVATAADGSFQLNTTSKFLNVQVSSVGFDIGEVNLLQGGKYRIALKPSAKTLSEVVVRGYGSQSLDSERADQYASALYANADHLQSKSIALNDSKDETREYKSDDAQKNLSGAISGLTLNYSAPAAVSTGTFATTDVLHISNLQVGVNHRSNNTNIEIKEIASNKPFIKILKETATTARYEKYLELRKNYLYTPGFYFDVARFFFTQHDKKTGLQILSTIDDLNLEDYELYKMLGYELKIQGEFEEEINVFKKVLDWRPQEPQSYRDYGLALADAGKYQAAVDSLYTAITKNYDSDKSGDFNGIEEIIVTEINNIIALHKNVNTSKIDNDLIRPMPVDVRVVLNWNMNDTDMDLWVTDPRNEKCFYGNHVTKTGGRISDDFTSGYGPEHFMLKKAMKGTYKVQLHFFGESVQKISGGTTVLAEIYTHYGKPNQERKLITLQMEKDEEKEGILVGEFSF